MVSLRMGGGGYFIEKNGFVTRKESFTADEKIGVHYNNIWKIAITIPSSVGMAFFPEQYSEPMQEG